MEGLRASVSMSEMSPQRRIAVLAASMAALSGVGPILLKGHIVLKAIWLGFMVIVAVYIFVQIAKLKGLNR